MWLNWKKDKDEILKTLKNKSGIYMLLCNTNNKCCIGSSLDLRNPGGERHPPTLKGGGAIAAGPNENLF